MRQDARRKYPWNEWLKGQPCEYTPEGDPKRFRTYLYDVAGRKDLYVSATITGDVVRFQFFETFSEYQKGKVKRPIHRTYTGRFSNEENAAGFKPAAYCTFCGKGVTGEAPDGATECYKYDFTADEYVKVHTEGEEQ